MSLTVTIATPAWNTIQREIHSATDGLETGGILLGHHQSNHIRTTVAGDPGPHARREPTRFLRDLDHARKLAASAWEIDQSQWIGEWHTHPDSDPSPSPLDLESYARHVADPDLQFTHFLSLIIGTIDGQTAAALWVVTGDAATLTRFTIEGAK